MDRLDPLDIDELRQLFIDARSYYRRRLRKIGEVGRKSATSNLLSVEACLRILEPDDA